jgi:hypothetical protein
VYQPSTSASSVASASRSEEIVAIYIDAIGVEVDWHLSIFEDGRGLMDGRRRLVDFPAGTFDFKKLQADLLTEIASTDQSLRTRYWVSCAVRGQNSTAGFSVRQRFAVPLFDRAFGAARRDSEFERFQELWKEQPPGRAAAPTVRPATLPSTSISLSQQVKRPPGKIVAVYVDALGFAVGWNLTIFEDGSGRVSERAVTVAFPAGTFDLPKLLPGLLNDIASTDQSWRTQFWVTVAVSDGDTGMGFYVHRKFAVPLFDKALEAARGDYRNQWYGELWKQSPPK